MLDNAYQMALDVRKASSHCQVAVAQRRPLQEVKLELHQATPWFQQQNDEDVLSSRIMNAARFHSEVLCIATADYRERGTQRADLTEWLASEQMFADSWLLLHPTLLSTWWQPLAEQRCSVKQALIDLLVVEKQSRQRYGGVLTSWYFTNTLCQRLLNLAATMTPPDDDDFPKEEWMKAYGEGVDGPSATVEGGYVIRA